MVSATQLSSYMYCPRKLFISKVLLVEEAPKEELIKGTVWHKTYEWINKNEKSVVEKIKTKNYPDISDIYRKEFAKFLRNSIIQHKKELRDFNIKLIDLFNDYWPHFEEEAKIRALNVSKFISEHNVFGEELWNKLTPKIISEQYIKSEKLDLSGIIDFIEVYDNIYVPVELKTGKVPAKGMWDGHRMQLAAYMLLLEDSGKNATEGVLKYKDAADKRILVMNSLLKDEVLDLIKKVALIFNSFDIPEKTDNKNKCEKCSFKDVCYNDSSILQLVEDAKNRQKAA